MRRLYILVQTLRCRLHCQLAAIIRAVLLGLVMTVSAQTVMADDMDKANEAFERADYAAAAGYLRPLAEAGDVMAQMRLGVLHHDGLGVDQDDAEAIRWWRKAADQGYADAEYAVGLCYDHGRGVSRDQAEAARWYEMAATQGHAEAQASLGLLHAFGEGMSRDLVLAWLWLSLAAGQGNDTARETLAAVSADMTADQLAEARKRLQEFQGQ